MQKRIFAIVLCAVMLSAFLPAASAARTARDGVGDAAYNNGIVKDWGFFDIEAVWSGDYYFRVKNSDGTYKPLTKLVEEIAYETGLQKPGFEGAITFRLENKSNDDWVFKIGAMQIEDRPNGYYIPDDKDHGTPMDDYGKTGNGIIRRFPNNNPPGFNASDMYETYKEYPANIMDKIQFDFYSAILSPTAPNPFRYGSDNKPYAPMNIDDNLREFGGWFTAEDPAGGLLGEKRFDGILRHGEVLYLHYTFYWDGAYYPVGSGSGRSLVSPRDGVEKFATNAGGNNWTIHDNYYMDTHALLRWDIDLRTAADYVGFTVRYLEYDPNNSDPNTWNVLRDPVTYTALETWELLGKWLIAGETFTYTAEGPRDTVFSVPGQPGWFYSCNYGKDGLSDMFDRDCTILLRSDSNLNIITLAYSEDPSIVVYIDQDGGDVLQAYRIPVDDLKALFGGQIAVIKDAGGVVWVIILDEYGFEIERHTLADFWARYKDVIFQYIMDRLPSGWEYKGGFEYDMLGFFKIVVNRTGGGGNGGGGTTTSPKPTPSVVPTEEPTTIPPVTETPPTAPTEPTEPTSGAVSPSATTSPGMPFTGGASLFNLFFVGLFLFGIGLIYLKSRKKEEKV